MINRYKTDSDPLTSNFSLRESIRKSAVSMSFSNSTVAELSAHTCVIIDCLSVRDTQQYGTNNDANECTPHPATSTKVINTMQLAHHWYTRLT